MIMLMLTCMHMHVAAESHTQSGLYSSRVPLPPRTPPTHLNQVPAFHPSIHTQRDVYDLIPFVPLPTDDKRILYQPHRTINILFGFITSQWRIQILLEGERNTKKCKPLRLGTVTNVLKRCRREGGHTTPTPSGSASVSLTKSY